MAQVVAGLRRQECEEPARRAEGTLHGWQTLKLVYIVNRLSYGANSPLHPHIQLLWTVTSVRH